MISSPKLWERNFNNATKVITGIILNVTDHFCQMCFVDVLMIFCYFMNSIN
ncbi:hypothetical protein ASZ90_008517 [hydrocarbon metagenome]|uniref:Uncharacterized protein n=1 Tax=hydrocarbon metagenome TaxID=938273 RepID=A0A0W8FLV2_9ZZZZ